MNEQAIQEQYQHIVTLLKQQRLKEAQSQLEAFLWNSGDWTLRNRLEQAQTSYQYMLQYMRQGIDDPERQKLYRQILTETWEVADQARLSLLDGVSTHYYHSLRNNRERLPKEYNIAALQKVLESFPDDLAVCQCRITKAWTPYCNGTNKPPRFFSFPHGVTVTGLQKTNSKPKDYWNQKCFPSMICACSPVPSCSV